MPHDIMSDIMSFLELNQAQSTATVSGRAATHMAISAHMPQWFMPPLHEATARMTMLTHSTVLRAVLSLQAHAAVVIQREISVIQSAT